MTPTLTVKDIRLTERDVPFAREQAGGGVEADPAGARDVDLGPGMQVGEIVRGTGRAVERLHVGLELDQVARHETRGEAEMAGDFLGALAARQSARDFAFSLGEQVKAVQAAQRQAAEVHVLEIGSGLDQDDEIAVGQDVGARAVDQAGQLFGQIIACPARPDIPELFAKRFETKQADPVP